MQGTDRLDLSKKAFKMLTEQFTAKDRVSIVTYASGVTTVLDGISGDKQKTIRDAIDALQAGGLTNGSGAIQKAYELAKKYKLTATTEYPTVNNRIFLATDGDFNVGASSETALKEMISTEFNSGINMTIMGFGYGNFKDNKLSMLTSSGSNGNFYFIDSEAEARKVLVDDISGTLNIVARDSKAEIIFNKDAVAEYRLIGYENKQLTVEEWDEPTTDAGEIGAETVVTAMYEIKPAASATGKYADFSIKYKLPLGQESEDNAEKTFKLEVEAKHYNNSENTPTVIKYEDKEYL